MRAVVISVVAVGLSIVAPGCDNTPSQPQQPFAVTISAPGDILGDSNLSPPGINCIWRTTAAATGGESTAHALWTSIDWEARRVSDDRLLGSGALTLAEVQDFWASDRILTNTSQTSAYWNATYLEAPWRVTITFGYRSQPGALTATKTTSTTCR